MEENVLDRRCFNIAPALMDVGRYASVFAVLRKIVLVMRHARVFSCLFLCLPLWLFMIGPAQAIEAVKLGLYELEFPPLQYRQNGELVGPDLDLLKEAFRRMPDYELTIEVLPVGRAQSKYRKGSVDIIFGYKVDLSRSYPRATSEPVRWVQFHLLTLADKKFTFKNLADLKGKRVGLLNYGLVDADLLAAEKAGQLKIERVRTYKALVQMLAKGRVDLLYGNPIVIEAEAKLQQQNMVSLMPAIGPKRGFFIWISKRSQLNDRNKFNQELSAAIKQTRDDGMAANILKQHGIERMDIITP